MKILVTGGTGFTGSHLVRRLLQSGHDVTVLDNQRGLFFDELEQLGAVMVLGSVTDETVLRAVIPGVDAIFHLAAAFRKVNLPKKVYWNVNVDGVRRLLELAAASAVGKIIYCSTQGVHGNVDSPPGDETTPIEPEDYYQLTKYEGERVVLEFAERGLDVTILRPTAIYGPGDPGRFLMLYRQVKKGFFPFFGNGRALYHPLYVDNFVDAFLLALTNPNGKGQAYLIADKSYYPIKAIVLEIARIMEVDLRTFHVPFWMLYSISTIVEMIYKPLPMDPPLFRRRADWFRQNRAFKIEKATRELGYEPAVDLSEGLRRTFEWYKAEGYL